MGEEDENKCEFCGNERILKRAPDIGASLITYFCPECSKADPKKYPWSTCPTCGGEGYTKTPRVVVNPDGSVTYVGVANKRTCYLCNGKGEIQVISWGEKEPKPPPPPLPPIQPLEPLPSDATKFWSIGRATLLLGIIAIGIGIFFFSPSLQSIFTSFENKIPKESTQPTSPITYIGDYSSAEKEIFNKINEIRKKNNIPTLKWNDKIRDIARERVRKLAEQGYFSHTSPSGEDLYDDLNKERLFYISAAENLYFAENIDIDSISKEAVEGWLKSPGHRSAILDYDNLYNEAGIAIYCKDRAFYVSAIFVNRHRKGDIDLKPNYLTFINLYDKAFPFDFTVKANIKLKSNMGINIYFVPSDKEFENLASNRAFYYYQQWKDVRALYETLYINKGEGLVIENRGINTAKITYDIEYEEPEEDLDVKVLYETLFVKICTEQYNETIKLKDHEFIYIPITLTGRVIKVLAEAQKSINVYVLNGTQTQIIKSYTQNILPHDSVINNCKSKFKKQVNITCMVDKEYSSPGVLIDNQGIGDNIINVSICG